MGKVYVDSSAMSTWHSQMQNINTSCLDDIDKINKALVSLHESFQGDYETAYSESFNDFCNTIKESHTNMKDFSGFLDKIFEIMNNQ